MLSRKRPGRLILKPVCVSSDHEKKVKVPVVQGTAGQPKSFLWYLVYEVLLTSFTYGMKLSTVALSQACSLLEP